MEYLTQNAVIPYLRERFQLTGTIKAKVLHVAGVGESTIDDWIGDLMTENNPTVGLLAHPGQVDIRITAKAESMLEADRMIAEMEQKVRARVGEGLFGTDQETLEETVLQALRDKGWNAVMVESGLNGSLRSRMERVHFPIENIAIIENPSSPEELREQVERMREKWKAEAGLGVSLQPGTEKATLTLYLSSPQGSNLIKRTFGGERALSNPWSVNNGLEFIRRVILGEKI
jgi:nicotinamide-nucleotide amidase